MLWSTHDVVRYSGVTSRTLRHYDDIGLLVPHRRGASGTRWYLAQDLVRLQRILLLRDQGLSLDTIAEVLAGTVDHRVALRRHIEQLRRELDRVNDQITSVEATLSALESGEELMPEHVFNGFDHTEYTEEVRERWGSEAADSAEAWWSDLDHEDRSAFMAEHAAIQDAYDRVIAEGAAPAEARSQSIAERHIAWITRSWQERVPTTEEIRGLADIYVADPRFAANYTRVYEHGAQFVRDALHARVECDA